MLANLPDLGSEPILLRYRHVAEFDPDSGYLESVAQHRDEAVRRRSR